MTSPLTAVAAYGIPTRHEFPSQPLPDPDWNELTSGVRAERIEGLLAASVEGGALPVTPAQLDWVRDAARARAKVDLGIEREMLRVSDHLSRHALGHRVLKGAVVARQFYPDPSWRGFGDVDILISGDVWYRSISALVDYGARRTMPEVRPGFDVRFGKDATMMSPAGIEIDLHRTLVVGPYGLWIDVQQIFSKTPEFVRIAGAEVPTLDANLSFLYSCYNAALADDPPRLAAVRDVAQIALQGQVDVAAAMTTATEWRGSSVVARAVRLVEEYVGCDLKQPGLEPRDSRIHRILIRSYRGAGRGYSSQLAGVVAVRGARMRLAYLRAIVRPQKAYLEARGWSSAQWGRHALSRLVGRP